MNGKWEEFYEKCRNCEKCELSKTRNNVVVGTGNINSDIMFIGEAPGENEDLQGEPFIGRGGKLLDSMLLEISLERKDVYIANIVKCRPPKNRDPKPIEISACIDYLYKQIEMVNPKVIVCLGRISATILIKKDFKITKEHGNWIEIQNINAKVMAVYHPAAVLRDPRRKADYLEDFIKIKQEIENIKKLNKEG